MGYDRDGHIAEMLSELPVMDEAEVTDRRAALQNRTGQPAMFTGPLGDVAVFVPMMVNLTEETLSQIPDLEKVTIQLLQLPGVMQVNYFQHWVGGAENAYGEDIIRTGVDAFEVFGGAQSTERMAVAWANRAP